MKTFAKPLAALALTLAVAATLPAARADTTPPPSSAPSAAAPATPATPAPAFPQTDRLPGIDLAEGISQITGTAISPLLGVSTVGAWKYFNTPAQSRHHLPWFCHPYAWGFGFCILSLCFIKDLLGPGTPALIKKPLDMAETFEDKVSALVATAGFVPYIASQMAETLSSIEPTTGAIAHSGMHLATAMPIASLNGTAALILVPLSMVSFLVVWMTAHGINVLISLCPFVWLDGFMKLGKLILLSLIPIAYAIAPWLGAAICIAILVAATILVRPSFRLTMFGTIVAGDIIFPWFRKNAARPATPHAFIAHRSTGLPIRTCGRIHRSDTGDLVFSHRPWLVMPAKTTTLPGDRHALVKGLLFPSLLHTPDSGDTTRLVMLAPRYRSHVDEIAEHCIITDIRENTIIRGFNAAKAWFAEVFQPSRNRIAR
ncbi:MAG: hypothetical protein Q7R22_012655 [Verrucomicrobiota bacterium JB025]|nr:hypothetical protein [Verrucomicrobiota bacterium JB025]